jgi:cation-transporting ATPase G
MSDAYCCSDEAGHDDHHEDARQRIWQVREIQLAALAGLLVVAGLLAGSVGSAVRGFLIARR